MNQIINKLKSIPKQYWLVASAITLAVGITTYKLTTRNKKKNRQHTQIATSPQPSPRISQQKSRRRTPQPTPEQSPQTSPQPSPRNAKQNREHMQLATSPQPSPRNLQSEDQQKTLIRLINSIKRILTNKTLESYEVVKAIYEGQFELSKTQAQTVITTNRSERRKLINNLKDYVELVSSEEDTLQEVHNKHLNALLAHFKISKEGWMNLVEQIAMRNRNEWDLVLVNSEEQELDSIRIKEKPKLKLSILIDIYRYRAKKLNEQLPTFEEIKKQCENSSFYTVVQRWVEDITAQKYRVQTEDINYSLNQLSKEEKDQLQQFKSEVDQIIEGLVLDQPDENDEQV